MERENLGLIFRTKLNKDSFSFLTINPSISQSRSYQQHLNQSLTNQWITVGLIFHSSPQLSIYPQAVFNLSVYIILSSIDLFKHPSKRQRINQHPSLIINRKAPLYLMTEISKRLNCWAPKPGRGAPEGSHSRWMSTKAHGYITRNKLL